MVPNVKGIEKMTLREIAEETERLIEDARTNKLSPDYLSGGTFTVTTDHSLVDGALSAKFLKEVVDIIENPYLLIN